MQKAIKKISPFIENVRALKLEFDALKNKLFGKNMFVVMDEESEDVKRYNQLLQFFAPQFRTKNYVNPLNSKI